MQKCSEAFACRLPRWAVPRYQKPPPPVLLLNNLTMTGSGATTLPTLLTPPEAAAALRISKAGLYRLVERRYIPFHRVGRGLRFDQADLVAYLQGTRVEPTINML